MLLGAMRCVSLCYIEVDTGITDFLFPRKLTETTDEASSLHHVRPNATLNLCRCELPRPEWGVYARIYNVRFAILR